MMLRLNPRFRAVLLYRKFWILIALFLLTIFLIIYSFSSSSGSLDVGNSRSSFNNKINNKKVESGESSLDIIGHHANNMKNHIYHKYNQLKNISQERSEKFVKQANKFWKENSAILSGPHTQHFKYEFNTSSSRLMSIIEDTMYFQQLQKLANKTMLYVKSIQPDYDVNARHCRCGKIAEDCHCCAKITIKKLRLNQIACVQFSYIVKEKAMKTKLLWNNNVVVEKMLSADALPTLCAGHTMELCASFRNTSYSVQLDGVHKTSLKGCVDLLILLQTRVIAAYPLGCFVAEGDLTSKDNSHKDYHVHMDNWMP